jgi:hypothetical protein
MVRGAPLSAEAWTRIGPGFGREAPECYLTVARSLAGGGPSLFGSG